MPSKTKRKASNLQPQIKDAIKVQNQQIPNKKIESELQSNKILPEKSWFKQHFAVGINEVTRLLERMAPSSDDTCVTAQKGSPPLVVDQGRDRSPCSSVSKLQAVLVASDCSSRWLTKHLPSLASSRNVQLISIKDNKEGSLRLGEVVKIKTAIALGVKVKGSSINQLIEEFLHHNKSKELNA